jgi:hypothetical protein
MKLPKEFFCLQLRFAEHTARVLSIPVEDALLTYSTLYMSFGLGRSFDPTHPVWQEYLASLKTKTEDNIEWTYTFYRRQYREDDSENGFGCFNYTYIAKTNKVRLHFVNRNISGYSALSREGMGARLQELTALFANVRKLHPEAEAVGDRSWLYNIQSYCRLFPTEYIQYATIAIDGEYPFLALWGQFLNGQEQIREKMARDFLAHIAREETFDGIQRCFPYLPLAPQCSIYYFYTFYKII